MLSKVEQKRLAAREWQKNNAERAPMQAGVPGFAPFQQSPVMPTAAMPLPPFMMGQQ